MLEQTCTCAWVFPDIDQARDDGLLAIGADLSPETVYYAHSKGIFPWFSPGEPIMWWTPDPRGVIYCRDIHLSRSLKKAINRLNTLKITLDYDFNHIITACMTRHGETWITPDMYHTYTQLHHAQLAHSCEVWLDGVIVGGLYGVALEHIFCAESMYSDQPNASKIALIAFARYLTHRGIELIDSQFLTPHLASMGGCEISRAQYSRHLGHHPQYHRGNWKKEITYELTEYYH